MVITDFKTSRLKGNTANENTNWKPQTKQTFNLLHDLELLILLRYFFFF